MKKTIIAMMMLTILATMVFAWTGDNPQLTAPSGGSYDKSIPITVSVSDPSPYTSPTRVYVYYTNNEFDECAPCNMCAEYLTVLPDDTFSGLVDFSSLPDETYAICIWTFEDGGDYSDYTTWSSPITLTSPCTPDWSCNGYASCLVNDTQNCN